MLMKTKKILFAGCMAFIFALAGCSNGVKAQTTGVVNCYYLEVDVGGQTFSNHYSQTYSEVYEYKDDNGNAIYASTQVSWNRYDEATGKYKTCTSLWVYRDRYTTEYTEYKYVRLVGQLMEEHNFYLDLDKRVIDSETKWSECRHEQSSSSSDSSMSYDNHEAYQKAKTGYFQSDSINYNSIKLDLAQKGLERHTYTILSEDSVITYRAKWFQ